MAGDGDGELPLAGPQGLSGLLLFLGPAGGHRALGRASGILRVGPAVMRFDGPGQGRVTEEGPQPGPGLVELQLRLAQVVGEVKGFSHRDSITPLREFSADPHPARVVTSRDGRW